MESTAELAGDGSFSAQPRGGRQQAGAPLACALLFCVLLFAYTRDNTFPFFYHPDEPDKVDQVITGKWNFHHPLLMLGTAELLKKALGVPDVEQRIVVMGRWLSATFAAGGVAAFALLGVRMRGPKGFFAGILLGSQHEVFELAHYFKEDTALLLAIGLALLALHSYWRRPGARNVALLGAACGLCLSAKYLGGIMLVPAAVIIVAAQRHSGRHPAHWGLLFSAFAAVAAAINWPILLQLDLFRHSFGREAELVAHGERAFSGQVPFFEYLRIFVANTNPAVWLLLLAELTMHWRTRRARDAFNWTMLIFPFAFTLLLSCSTKTNDRYFLPATAGFYYLSTLGACDLPGFRGIGREAFYRAAVGLAFVANLIPTARYRAAFEHDDRAELQQWIKANLPANAVIAGEDHVDLPVPRRRERLAVQALLPQTVIETKYAADLASTPADLAAKGVDYIVISESDYGLFFRRAAAHLAPPLQRKKDFYITLFNEEKPLWERERGRTGIYLHPGLQVYRLKPAS